MKVVPCGGHVNFISKKEIEEEEKNWMLVLGVRYKTMIKVAQIMIPLQYILLILMAVVSCCICEASPPQFSAIHHSTSWESSTLRISSRHKRQVAFMFIPRGGGGSSSYTTTSDNDNDDADAEYDDIGENTKESKDNEEEPLDPILYDTLEVGLQQQQPLSKFLSFLSPQSVIHYAHILFRVTRRACRAGALAAIHNNDVIDDEEESGNNRPVVQHTILERTVHVLGEMYHAALEPESEEYIIDDHDKLSIIAQQDDNDIKEKKNIKRRKRRKHHHHHQKQKHTTSPTAIPVCGGIEPSHNNNSQHDAILQLSKQYSINLPTNENNQLSKKYNSILLSSHTSLNEALQLANSEARFLICYISKGNTNNNKKNNAIVIPNLLSPDVIKVINRKPLGKRQVGDTASFYIWITNDASDKDVDMAMKRLKVKPPTSRGNSSKEKKKKSKSSSSSSTAPILTIIYPATTFDPRSSTIKVSPKVLAQHHCHPPPSTSETLLSWMSTIRKRHLRNYAKLQHDRRELQLLQERTRGYVSSMKEDATRDEEDEVERQKKKEIEEKEEERIQYILERRTRLLESLVDEPPIIGSSSSLSSNHDGADVITIALRFVNGSNNVNRDTTTLKRRFLSKETSMNDVFNWIDAVHGLEREKIELCTMNGAKKFVYVNDDDDDNDDAVEESGENNVTLEEAGLGKMTALRVLEILDGTEEEEDDESDGDDESGEESEEEGDEDS